MQKLSAAILKDFRILIRDKAGLAIMFAMPVLLVIIITSIQNSSFKIINENKVPLLVCNRDTAESSRQFITALRKIGMFDLLLSGADVTDKELTEMMHQKDALVAIVIPTGFSADVSEKANAVTHRALNEFGMTVKEETAPSVGNALPVSVTMFYNPVLQESFRLSVKGALRSAQQFTENREVLQALYQALNQKKLNDSMEQQMLNYQSAIVEIPVASDGTKNIPDVTQHNVPAWTIFAMFFIVVSLSSNVVKEKLSGSFVRLKTLPTSYVLILAAKQITYIGVTLIQVLVIFSLGIFLFPHLGLPVLKLPPSLAVLVLVSVISGWCAVSYGILVGVYSRTMEQAIGFGAVSVVILAAIGGIVVPAFAMPDSLRLMMKISPLHWCMEAYNILFLQGGAGKEVLYSLLPLLAITIAMQFAALAGLKRQNLI